MRCMGIMGMKDVCMEQIKEAEDLMMDKQQQRSLELFRVKL